MKEDKFMENKMLRVMENALRGFIEDTIQSEGGLSQDDIEYITAERERIRQMRLKMAA